MAELAPDPHPWPFSPMGGAGIELELRSGPTARRVASTTAMLFGGALLVDAMRDELHAEIYTYFKWLEQGLVMAGPKSRADEAGTSLAGVRGVLRSLEAGFRSVRADAVVLGGVARDLAVAGKAPLLERYRGDGPGSRTEEAGKQGGNGSRGEVPVEGAEAGPIAAQSPPAPRTCQPAESSRPYPPMATEATELSTEEAEEAPLLPQQEKGMASAAIKKSNSASAPCDLARRRPRSVPLDFDAGFDLLAAYKAEHGDCEPDPGTRLGRWVHGMRKGWAELMEGDGDGDGDGGDSYIVSVQAPPGPLGVGVKFEEEGDERRAVIVEVCGECTFKHRAGVGDCIATIDESVVSDPEDLTIGVRRNRMVGIIPKERLGRPPLPTKDQIGRMESIGFLWEGKATCSRMEKTGERRGGEDRGGVPQEGAEAGPIAAQSPPAPHTCHAAEPSRPYPPMATKATAKVAESAAVEAEEASPPPPQQTASAAIKKSNSASAPDDPARRKRRCMPFDFETGFDLLVAHRAEHGDHEPNDMTRLGRWVFGMRRGWAELMDGGGGGGDSYVVPVQAPPGPLGVGVKFEEEGGVRRAVIADVCGNCTFKGRANVGDCIATIDGSVVSDQGDLTIGARRNRIVGIIPKEQLGRRPPLPTKDQIRRMESIGFSFEGKASCPTWDSHFQDLLEFARVNGHCRVPREYKTEGSFRLGNWVHEERKLYQAKNRGFMKHKAPKLDAIGFVWKPSKDNFEAKFKELVEYKRINGHVNVPCNRNNSNPNRKLGVWVNALRKSKRRMETKDPDNEEGRRSNYLTNERIQLLDSVGFEWVKSSKRSRKKSSSVHANVDLDDESVDDPHIAEQSAEEIHPAEQSAEETYPAKQSAETYPAEQSQQYYAWGE